ncbi:MAG: WD40/YVTN/BNR-like repeat-containing protein [Acidimicrobiales bacterium]
MTDHLLAAGTRKGLFLARSADDRTTWELDGPLFPANAVYAVAVDARRQPPRILAGTHSEHWGPTVFRSDDHGTTWEETEGGAARFPADCGGALKRVWQLLPGRADEPDVVWAGGEPGSLFRSDDGGNSFALNEGLWNHPHRAKWEPGGGGQCLHTILLHPIDINRVMVGVSTGGVYRTDDAGATWEAANSGISTGFLPDEFPEFGQCVHKIAGHPNRPDQLFLQNHGGVYRSDDGGDSWHPIGGDLPADFGFPIVAHPHRPDTAYVFPLISAEQRRPPDAKARVYRTADAGATWEPLSAGLPQEHAYTTVLRDAMCVDQSDPAGIYFGTRTGELFASRDDGESWTAIARHLPDVLVVRAAAIG